MKSIVCMKWGTLYGADYVNTLYSMVKRNITGEFRFVCLTDNPVGINPAVEIRECPSLVLSPEYAAHKTGGWRKLTLWDSSVFHKDETWVFFDLDVIIVDNIDALFDYEPQETFIVMQNWTQKGKNIGNTSVFRFTVGKHDYLFNNFSKNFAQIINDPATKNEQIYISKNISSMKFWPDEWCILFKVQCIPPFPQRLWKETSIPKGTKVIAFPGVPNPHQAKDGIWPAKWYKKFYKTIKPATWINDYWKVN
ncbi:MAG: glycosyltransferase [Sulfurospirillaceae bacterium]|nr:glycosyltransferase [Sulfurospirillaceae bacterium]MDD2826307.1 glycosyltransferase [Sulfurospirillaceae bacterium]